MISEAILEQAALAEHERLVRIAKAWDAYFGRLPRPLRPTASDPTGADNILLNFAGPIVDKGASFLMGRHVGFDVDGRKETPADLLLEGCWKQNRRMTLLHKLATNGGVCGDMFLKILEPLPGQRCPRLVNLDPATVLPLWDVDNFDDIHAYRIQWNAVDPFNGSPVVRRELLEKDGSRWRITNWISRGDSAAWALLSDTVWPFAWCPLHHGQNLPSPNTYWGLSDLEQHVVSVNNALNFVMSNMARILRHHAHPMTWGTGFSETQLKTGVDSLLGLPNGATLQNLEMKSDLGSSMELYKRLKEALHEIARVPEVAVGKLDSVGTLSGVALKILYQSLIEKNDTKQLTYGEMLDEVNAHILEVSGDREEHTLATRWPDPLPVDGTAQAQTARTLQELGVSRETLLTDLGYDAGAEREKRAAESSPPAGSAADN